MGAAVDRHDRLEEWLAPFRILFTRPTWQRVLVLANPDDASPDGVTGHRTREDAGFSRYHFCRFRLAAATFRFEKGGPT